MAEAKKAEGAESAPPPKKKGKLMLFIIIGVVLVVLIGGAGAFFLLKKKHPTDEDGEEAVAEETVKKSKKDKPDAPPVFVKLEPFTVKLQSEGQESYLQAQPELRVLDAAIGERIKQYMPEIRHRALLTFASKKNTDVTTPQGVQQLSNELRVEINNIIAPPKPKGKGKGKPEEKPAEPGDKADPDDPVQAVLFTSFIVQ